MEFDILDCLEQLGYDGPLKKEAALLQAAQGGLTSAEYVDLCRWLVSRLKPLCDLEETIAPGPEDLDSLEVNIRGLLKELCCPYEMSVILKGDTKDHLKFVLFLSSELQAAQIATSKRGGLWGQNAGKASLELRQICQIVNVPLREGQDAADVLSLVQKKVDTLVGNFPNGVVGKPALKKALSSEQWEKLRSMNALMSSEYECRRRMLIKRLDVTIQSFGWSDRAKARVDSMAQAYQPKRHALRAEATVDAAALLAAREDVCYVVKTSSGASRENTACAVNKAGDHDLGEDDHAAAPHSGAAVHQYGQVAVLWLTNAVGVPPHRLDLLQVGWKHRDTHVRPPKVIAKVRSKTTH
uniref:Family with sequence similarity 98 member B n=1 Tax=Hippocampus comes TaxID=109280 RepID=A0A3Q2XKU5_HIPCM